jgi:hypothetical protein
MKSSISNDMDGMPTSVTHMIESKARDEDTPTSSSLEWIRQIVDRLID